MDNQKFRAALWFVFLFLILSLSCLFFSPSKTQNRFHSYTGYRMERERLSNHSGALYLTQKLSTTKER